MASPSHVEDVNLFALDTETSPYLVRQGGLLRAENVVMVNKGRWQKRFGTAPLETLPNIGSLDWCASYGNELLVGGGTEQLSYTPNSNGWLKKGFVQSLSANTTLVAGGTGDGTNVDYAVNSSSGFSCYVWQQLSAGPNSQPVVFYTVFDSTDGSQVMPPSTIVHLQTPRVVAIGPYFVVVGVESSAGGLKAYVISPVQRTISSPVVIAGSSGINCFDARAVSGASVGHGGQYVALAWGSGTFLAVAGVDPWALTLCVNSTAIDSNATTGCCMTVTPDLIYVMDYRPESLNLETFSLNMAFISSVQIDTPISGAVFNKMTISSNLTGSYLAVYEEGPTYHNGIPITFASLKVAQGLRSSIPSTVAYTKRNMELAGDIYQDTSGSYNVLTVYQGASTIDQPTFFLEQIAYINSSGVVTLNAAALETARIEQDNAGGYIGNQVPPGAGTDINGNPLWGATNPPLPQWTGSNNGASYGICVLTQSSASFEGNYVPVRAVGSVALVRGQQPFSAQLGADLYLSGGFLNQYDGQSITEQNYHVTPEPITGYYSGVGVIRTAVGVGASPHAVLTLTDSAGYGLVFTAVNPNQAFTVTFTPTGGYLATVNGNSITVAYATETGVVPTVAWLVLNGIESVAPSLVTVTAFSGSGYDPGIDTGVYKSTFTGSSGSAVAESFDLYVPPDYSNADETKYGSGWQIVPSSYILLASCVGAGAGQSVPDGYIWFSVDGEGADPAPLGTGGSSILCAVDSLDSAQTVAAKLYGCLIQFYINDAPNAAAVGIVSAPVGNVTPPTGGAGLATWRVSVSCGQGGGGPIEAYPGFPPSYSLQFRCDVTMVAASYEPGGGAISCPLGIAINPGGYFICQATATQFYAFYFVVNGIGSAPTGPYPLPGLYAVIPTVTPVPVPISSWYTGAQVASAVTSAMLPYFPTAANQYFNPGYVTPVVTYTLLTAGLLGPYDVSSSGVLPDGQYQTLGVWERTDAKGQLEQSGTGLPAVIPIQGAGPTFDPAGNQYQGNGSTNNSGILTVNPSGHGMLLFGYPVGGSALFLSCPALWATHKNSQLAFYRTTVSAGQNPSFYRTSSAAADPLNVSNPLYNFPAALSINPVSGTATYQDQLYFFDNSPDSKINSNTGLYTTGAVLDNAPIPACTFLHSHRGRLWAILSSGQLRYSQPWVLEQQLTVNFADDLFIDVPQDGGSPVALATVDDKLVVFCTAGIYYIAGDGPTSTGQGDFVPIQPVMTDTGCVAGSSVLATPEGIWYQSAKGLYFLDRNLQVSFRGVSVMGLTTGMTCNGGILMPDRQELRFFFSAVAGGATPVSDYTLVFNYQYNVWSKFTGWAGNSATMWQGALTFVDSLGNVRQEQFSSYLDNGAYVRALLQSGWVGKSSGLQGWLRIPKAALLGAFGSGQIMQVFVSYDYENTAYEVDYDATQILNQQNYAAANLLPAYNANTPYGITDGAAWNFRLFLPPSPRGGRTSSVSLTIQDTQDQPNGSGFMLDAVSLEIQAFGKLNRFGTSRSSG